MSSLSFSSHRRLLFARGFVLSLRISTRPLYPALSCPSHTTRKVLHLPVAFRVKVFFTVKLEMPLVAHFRTPPLSPIIFSSWLGEGMGRDKDKPKVAFLHLQDRRSCARESGAQPARSVLGSKRSFKARTWGASPSDADSLPRGKNLALSHSCFPD